MAAFLPDLPVGLAEPERWCRAAVASTFLASLELTRDGTITVQQEIAWMPIMVGQGSAPMSAEAAIV